MKITSKTLVPPQNIGRKVSQDDWNSWFPDAPKRPNESEEEYLKRKGSENNG